MLLVSAHLEVQGNNLLCTSRYFYDVAMDIILNKIAIWRPCGSAKLNKRLSPVGTRYLKNGDATYKTSDSPLIRYCKDYTIDKVKFSLFVRTDVEDDKKVKAALDACAKELTKAQVLEHLSKGSYMDFDYLDHYIGGTK